VTIVPVLVFIIVLIIRVLFLSVVFPCCCSCSGQVTGDSSEREL
jgi:hypothetical protein